MAMELIKDAVVTTGKYTNNAGEEKSSYMTIGKLFRRDNDTLCMKLDSVPVGSEFSGWINFYDRKERSDVPAQAARAPYPSVSPNIEDDIPFD